VGISPDPQNGFCDFLARMIRVKGQTMLVLTRKVGEAIQISEHITVKVLDLRGNRAKIGIEAPKTVNIQRVQAVAADRDESSGQTRVGRDLVRAHG
jgi:carbon storage regulator